MTDTAGLETTADVDAYCAAVRTALADLPDDARDELLEDLSDHLTEVLAEGEGSLRDRLGDPATYAMELRSAAGLEPAVEPIAVPAGVQARILETLRRTSAAVGRLDVRLGRLVGYPRAADLLRGLAPGWWVLRGWIVAQLVCSQRRGDGWTGFIPPLGNSRLLGGAVTLALIAVSVLIGRATPRFTEWPRRIGYLLSTGIAVWAVAVLAPYIGSTHYVFETDPAGATQYIGNGNGNLSDVYVYDQSGNPVPNARLFDQDGIPVQLGDPDCPDSGRGISSNAVDPATGGPASDDWVYPLCPNAPGPFRAGPGPVSTTPTPPLASAGSSSAPVTPATSSAPVGKASRSIPTATASPGG
jgi:hypothetical protein